MASKVEIVNSALTQLGQQRITSFDDESIPAQDASAIYNLVVEEIISKGMFPSSKTRATLAASSDTPEFEYSNKFQLPTDPKCLRVLRVNGQDVSKLDYKIESGYLLINDTACEIIYISFVEDSESYDAYLTQAITYGLMEKLSFKYVASASYSDGIRKAAQQEILRLMALAATASGTSDPLRSDKYIESRF